MAHQINSPAGRQSKIDHPAILVLGPEEAAAMTLLASRIIQQSFPDDSDVRDTSDLVKIAYRIYQSRRYRDQFFGSGLFSEPAWDLLLAAYCLDSPQRRLTVSGLCYAAGCPFTTALRWIERPEKIKLIERSKCKHDGRMILAYLTQEGRDRIEKYLRQMANWLVQDPRYYDTEEEFRA